MSNSNKTSNENVNSNVTDAVSFFFYIISRILPNHIGWVSLEFLLIYALRIASTSNGMVITRLYHVPAISF